MTRLSDEAVAVARARLGKIRSMGGLLLNEDTLNCLGIANALLADRDALAAEVAARDDRIARLLTTLGQQDAAKIKAEDSVATLTAKVDRFAAEVEALKREAAGNTMILRQLDEYNGTLAAEVERLTAALKPFAAAYDRSHKSWQTTLPPLQAVTGNLHIEDFKRASDALAATPEPLEKCPENASRASPSSPTEPPPGPA